MSATDKLHTACDECRTRKLKCSRDTPRCARCQSENITCIYSPRQPMGRPRKRRREDEAAADASVEVPAHHLNDLDITLDSLSALPSFDDFGMISSSELHYLNDDIGNEAVSCSHPDSEFLNTSTLTPISDLNFSLDPSLDPSPWNLQSTLTQLQLQPEQDPPSGLSNTTPCNCLSLTYLTLADLQSVPTFSFPLVIQPLRKAMTTISTLIHCAHCPLDFFSASQNVSSLSALFKAITSRYSKVLYEAELETARLVEHGAKKSYRIGDNSAALAHMHTGTLDCPMGIDVDLEPRDWHRLVKTALKMEVYGGGGRAVWLLGLLEETERRQERWHKQMEFQSKESMKMLGNMSSCAHKTCHALGAEHLRMMINALDFE